MRAAPAIDAARVLAWLTVAGGGIGEGELDALEAVRGFQRLAIGRSQFAQLAQRLADRIGREPAAGSIEQTDRLLDAVTDPDDRLLVCRLALAVITADGLVTRDERQLYESACRRWGITQPMVMRLILDEARRSRPALPLT